VDDDALIRVKLGAELEALGFVVVEARDGQEALEVYAKEAPDALFLDLLMPKLNGLDALKRLRDLGCTAPAVLVTALTSEAVKQFEVEGVKPDAYIEKPFRPKTLARIVKQLFPK
jgi:CheY-like chemotaxis protein